MLVPESNVKEASTSESPGLLTVWEAGKGQDVRGILKEPIRLDEYPLPWEFQMGVVQNFNVIACGVDNAAVGLNVAVTFSDPSTWPKDRTQMPPNTHSVQLFVIELNQLPQYSPNPHGFSSYIWGRGDLSRTLTGNWNIPAVWAGDGSLNSGPSSNEIFFRFVTGKSSESAMSVGVKFNASNGWNMRNFDCSKYGRPTGIWQIGPIISGDRWIPDVLCEALPRTPRRLYLCRQADRLG